MGRRPAARLALLLGSAALALLLVEGAAALLAGRSLLCRLAGPPAARDAAPPTDAERRRAAANNPGPYAVHPDPFVGYVLRGESELTLFGGRLRSDGLGLRARPGPDHDTPPLRIAVVGDSVAFGYGLDDDQTLAHQLERLLDELRPEGGRPVECRTVALPGWNCRNALSFLLDNWLVLNPDIVLYLPIHNDLLDTDGVLETGHRRQAPDIANADPFLTTSGTASYAFVRALVGDDPEAVRRLQDIAGPIALTADLTPESWRRYEDNTRLMTLLSRFLAVRDRKLLFVAYETSPFLLHLQRRLVQEGAQAPVLPLFTEVTPDMMLPDDPHPNARTTAAMAAFIATDLVARGWVEARPGVAPPPVDERFTRARAPALSDEELLALSAEELQHARATLRPVADFRTGEGLAQVYGNLNRDGSTGCRLMLALAPTGRMLDVELAPITERQDLYPLPVIVEVDGVRVGVLHLRWEEPARERFALPERKDPDAPLEVRIVPWRWVTLDIRGLAQLVSFRAVRIAVTD